MGLPHVSDPGLLSFSDLFRTGLYQTDAIALFSLLYSVSRTVSSGGLFLWVTMPEHVDCDEMFKVAIKENVAYVIGSAFYPKGDKKNSFRLNFSYPSKDDIVEGVKRLAKVINETI